MIDVIRYYRVSDCKPYDDTHESQFSVYAFFATFAVWALCFVAVFKGVHSSSYLVWFTVPVPLLFIVIMVINGATLEGAGTGVGYYLQGKTFDQKFPGLTGEDRTAKLAEYQLSQ
jgi:SNF family Na+-dependent transporter